MPQALRRVTPAADVAGPTRLLRPWAQRSCLVRSASVVECYRQLDMVITHWAGLRALSHAARDARSRQGVATEGALGHSRGARSGVLSAHAAGLALAS